MFLNNLKIGNIGEKAACSFLKKSGYKIIKKNYRKKFGEIDIIAEKDGDVSFVEVKTRSSNDYGTPCQAVNKAKQERIIKTAKAYIIENSLDKNYTFDVIEIFHSNGKITDITHIEGAFGVF